MDELPSIFSIAENCTYMSFAAATLGTAKKPAALLGAVTRVSELYISTHEDMHVLISGDVKWSKVYMAGVTELDIRRVLAQLNSLAKCACVPPSLGPLSVILEVMSAFHPLLHAGLRRTTHGIACLARSTHFASFTS